MDAAWAAGAAAITAGAAGADKSNKEEAAAGSLLFVYRDFTSSSMGFRSPCRREGWAPSAG